MCFINRFGVIVQISLLHTAYGTLHHIFLNKSYKPCKHDSYSTNVFLKMKLYVQPVHHPVDKNYEMHPKPSPKKSSCWLLLLILSSET
ncbi:hypothetical protein GIB67_019092 [Kingdonia uniflora]|uniref:Uncharacterized protein n=1 Tax=Kingdonia uniflora TaxID=39325 RepID=A0A7J7MZJ8_9MAGN|nr:hypothetical protein GIB67_019092 [Kingdonia uniflora]